MSRARLSGLGKLALLGAALGLGVNAATPAPVKTSAPQLIGYGTQQLIGDPWRIRAPRQQRGMTPKGTIKIGRGRSQMARKRQRRHRKGWRT